MPPARKGSLPSAGDDPGATHITSAHSTVLYLAMWSYLPAEEVGKLVLSAFVFRKVNEFGRGNEFSGERDNRFRGYS